MIMTLSRKSEKGVLTFFKKVTNVVHALELKEFDCGVLHHRTLTFGRSLEHPTKGCLDDGRFVLTNVLYRLRVGVRAKSQHGGEEKKRFRAV